MRADPSSAHRQHLLVHNPAQRNNPTVQHGLGMSVSQEADKRLFIPANFGHAPVDAITAPHQSNLFAPSTQGGRRVMPRLSIPAWTSGVVPTAMAPNVVLQPARLPSAEAQSSTSLHLNSIGISLNACSESDSLFEVVKIHPEGPAQRSRQVRVGDRLIKVNDVAFTSRSAKEIHAKLEGAGCATSHLVLQRRSGTTYFVTLQRTGFGDTDISQQDSTDVLREVLGEGFEGSIWSDAFSADQSTSGSAPVLHSTGTTQIHAAGSTVNSVVDLDDVMASSKVELPSLEIDLQTDTSSHAPESPRPRKQHNSGHQSPIATRREIGDDSREESISFQAALAKAVSLSSTQDRVGENMLRTPRTFSKMPKVKTRDLAEMKFANHGWQSPRGASKLQSEMNFGRTCSATSARSAARKSAGKRVPEVLYATPLKTASSVSTPRVLQARTVTKEELTEAALGVIPILQHSDNARNERDAVAMEMSSDSGGWVVQPPASRPSSAERRLVERAEASEEAAAGRDKDILVGEAGVRKVVLRASEEEELRMDSGMAGGMGPILRAGAILEVQQRKRSLHVDGWRTLSSSSAHATRWPQLAAATCVAATAVAATVKINQDLGIEGWPEAPGWSLMLSPLWMLWLFGLQLEARLVQAVTRGQGWVSAMAMARDSGSMSSLAYGNSGLCGTALLLALQADGVVASDPAALHWAAVLPALVWVWTLAGATLAWALRRDRAEGAGEGAALSTCAAVLLAPAATASLVTLVVVVRTSADPPTWGWYGVAAPLWGWLGLTLMAALVRLKQSIRAVDNDLLAVSLHIASDAVVWLVLSVWAVLWMQEEVGQRSACWWPLPWVGAWLVRVCVACAVCVARAEKVRDVQVHLEGEEILLSWQRGAEGRGARANWCWGPMPVRYEVELLEVSGLGQNVRVYAGSQARCRLAARWIGGEEASLRIRVVMKVLLGERSEASCTVLLGEGDEGPNVSVEQEARGAGHGLLAVKSLMEDGRLEVEHLVHTGSAPGARERGPAALQVEAQTGAEKRRTSVMSFLVNRIGGTHGAPSDEPSTPTATSRERPEAVAVDVREARQLQVDVGYFPVDSPRQAQGAEGR